MFDLHCVRLVGFLWLVCVVVLAQPPPGLVPAQPARVKPVTLYPDHHDDQTLIPPLITTTIAPIKTTTNSYLWERDQYPNPNIQFIECRQPGPSLLCDPDGLLSNEDAKKVRDQQSALSTNISRCFCPECPPGDVGLKVGVAIVKTIFRRYKCNSLRCLTAGNTYKVVNVNGKGSDVNEYSNEYCLSHDQEEQDFANFLRRQWHLGSCNNSLLLLYISMDNQISISSGSVAAQIIPETVLEDAIRVSFSKRDVTLADELLMLLKQINSTMHMQHGYAPNRKIGDPKDELAPATTTALVVVGVLFAFLLVVSMIISAIMLMKNKYENQDEQPEIGSEGEGTDGEKNTSEEDAEPQGYWNDPETRKRESVRRPNTAKVTEYVPVSIDEDETNHNRPGKKSLDNSQTDDETN